MVFFKENNKQTSRKERAGNDVFLLIYYEKINDNFNGMYSLF